MLEPLLLVTVRPAPGPVKTGSFEGHLVPPRMGDQCQMSAGSPASASDTLAPSAPGATQTVMALTGSPSAWRRRREERLGAPSPASGERAREVRDSIGFWTEDPLPQRAHQPLTWSTFSRRGINQARPRIASEARAVPPAAGLGGANPHSPSAPVHSSSVERARSTRLGASRPLGPPVRRG